MMSRNRFMQKQIFIGIHIVFFYIRDRHIKNSRTRTVNRALVVFGTRRSLPKSFSTPDFKWRFRLHVEKLIQIWLHLFVNRFEIVNDLLWLSKRHQFFSVAYIIEERLQVSLEANLCFYLFHFR